jgi:pimeloyl-ACP methyl ester carboxylesterase/DNA-binding transcriptional MerR regulator
MGIGEFARLSRLSSHALRRYDEMGLLPPRRVDAGSGYRWYAAEQLEQARLIAALRQLGMPLARIKAVTGLPDVAVAAEIAGWWSDAEAEHAARRELAGFLRDRLNGKRSVMYEVSVRTVPSRNVLSLLRHVRWDEFVGVAHDFSSRFGGVPRLEGAAGASFIAYHGEVSQDSDGPAELCRPVPVEIAAELAAEFPDLVLRTEAEHEEAYVHLARDGRQTPSAQSMLVLETLLAWAAEQGRRPSGSVRQVFTAGGPSAAGLACDFAIPLAAPAVSVGMTSGIAAADGADIYYERRGDGPPLLLIAGGGGDAGIYSALADIMAGSYTVLTYDRRGNSRSRLHGAPTALTMDSQAGDAVAVLRACGFSSAAVFGNSGGATIALDLAARYPDSVTVAVAHEPPLPDTDAARAVFREIARVLEQDGWQAAFTLLQTRLGDMAAEDVPLLLHPGSEDAVLARMAGNWEYMIRYEIQPFVSYQVPYDRLRATGVRIVVGAGDQADEDMRRISTGVASRLDAEFAAFPGGHDAPMELPGPFAARLRELLAPPLG